MFRPTFFSPDPVLLHFFQFHINRRKFTQFFCLTLAQIITYPAKKFFRRKFYTFPPDLILSQIFPAVILFYSVFRYFQDSSANPTRGIHIFVNRLLSSVQISLASFARRIWDYVIRHLSSDILAYILSGAENPSRSIEVSSTSRVRSSRPIQLLFCASFSSLRIFVS